MQLLHLLQSFSSSSHSLSPPANFFTFILSTILTFWRHSYITPVSIKIYNYSWCHPIFISVDSTTHSPLPATHSLLSKLGPSYRSQAQCLLTAQLIPCPSHRHANRPLFQRVSRSKSSTARPRSDYCGLGCLSWPAGQSIGLPLPPLCPKNVVEPLSIRLKTRLIVENDNRIEIAVGKVCS